MLRSSILLIGFLTAAPLSAQKPGAEELDPERSRFRDRALAICVSEVAGAQAMSAETSESICQCTVGRFMPRWPTGALPPLRSTQLPSAMSGDLIACAGEEEPALASAVARRIAQAPAVPPLAAVSLAPDKPRPQREQEPDSGLFDGITLPEWLTDSDLPVWAMIPLALFVLLFLRGLFRRGEDRDLLGPPPGMRRTSVPPPRQP